MLIFQNRTVQVLKPLNAKNQGNEGQESFV